MSSFKNLNNILEGANYLRVFGYLAALMGLCLVIKIPLLVIGLEDHLGWIFFIELVQAWSDCSLSWDSISYWSFG